MPGLVRGASKGEGLGNQFLANIREVDAIAHVRALLRGCRLTHVEGRIDPIADIETVETELMLADLDSLERRVDALEKRAKGGDKDAERDARSINRALALLRDGKPARLVDRKPEEEQPFTARPVHVDPGALCLQCRGGGGRDRQRLLAQGGGARQSEGAATVVISAKIESEIAVLSREDRTIIWRRSAWRSQASTGSSAPAMRSLACHLFHGRAEGSAGLDGDPRAHAPQAAGVIHTDFEHGFIRAETIAYDDYVAGAGKPAHAMPAAAPGR